MFFSFINDAILNIYFFIIFAKKNWIMLHCIRLLAFPFCIVWAFLLQGCSSPQQWAQDENEEVKVTLFNHFVPVEKAEYELNAFLAEISPSLKSSARRVIGHCYTIKAASTKAEGEPIILYVFNFEDNQGYAIMPGDDRVPSPMCFVEEGQYAGDDPDMDLDDFIMSELKAMYQAARVLPDSIKYEISLLPEGFIPETKASGYFPVDTVYSDDRIYVYYSWAQNGTPVGSLLETEWGQGDPFNDLCPLVWDNNDSSYVRAKAGCVPVAVAQIMAYWKLNPIAGSPYYGLNWNYISPILTRYSTPTNYTGWTMLKSLIKTLGDPDNLNAVYGADSTSASTSNVPRTFERFDYSQGGVIQNYSIDSLLQALHYGPVLGRGSSKKHYDTNGNIHYYGGHAWVFDQCLSRMRPVVVYDTDWHIITSQMQVQRLFHINWGWYRVHNGYFTNCHFDSNSPIVYPLLNTKSPSDALDVDGYYQYNLKIITGIRP
ncbi:MAG: C10 family peptidase [Bacteroidales bacterium]|nr:C10 family peptidase [Bacteroidales bacterium]